MLTNKESLALSPLEYGPLAPPKPEVWAEMQRQGWTLAQRDAAIRSNLSSQALSGIFIPIDLMTEVFGEVIFRPLPEIG